MSDLHAHGYSPTVMKRSLSRKLVELRKQCGLSTAEVCKRLDWSGGKLYHIESASWVKPNGDDVAELCELYGVEGEQRDALVKLARDARQRGWWRKYNDVFANELPGFEAGASLIRTFVTTVVPGLLQTPAYIDFMQRTAGVKDNTEVKRRAEARLERQKILTRAVQPAKLHALIDEDAILRITDPEIRSDQVDHLINMNRQGHVTVEIVPISAGPYAGNGEGFTLLDFPDPQERSLVFIEGAVDERFLEELDEIERYTLRFDQIRAASLDPKKSAAHLRKLIE